MTHTTKVDVRDYMLFELEGDRDFYIDEHGGIVAHKLADDVAEYYDLYDENGHILGWVIEIARAVADTA